ncbi:hypothetical protein IT087_03740 [Candidatus Uhrbacteria bacterium]|nr:hypothetical protein [Candidatus Uhrbacteria bacterium]
MDQRITAWIVVLLTSGAMLGNAFLGTGPTFTRAAIAFALLYHSVTFGAKLLQRKEGPAPFLLGLAAILAVQSIFQVAFYYAGMNLGVWTDAWSLSLTLILGQLLFSFKEEEETREDDDTSLEKPAYVWIAAAAIPAVIAFGFVLRAASLNATIDSIRTPWPLLPAGTLAALALIPLCAWFAAWKAKSRLTVAVLAGLAVAAVAIIAPLVYSVGYGFDGFLHVASEKIVAETGTLSPKPLYYMGQYVFVTWLSRFINLPLEIVDRFLVPIAAALLPLLLLLTPKTEQRGWRDAAFLLFLPLASFVATTPQSLAYVAGLAALLSALDSSARKPHPAVALSFAAWSLTIHPLAGLPFACATLALLTSRRIFSWIFVAAAGLAIPVSFLIISRGASTTIAWDFSKLIDIGTWFQSLSALVPPRNRVALWPDWTAIVLFLTFPVALLSACLAAWKDLGRRKTWALLVGSALACVVAGIILRAAGDFAFLIDYERGNYADRLFLIALFLLIPAAAAGAGRLLALLETAPALSIVTIFIGLSAWHGAQAYAALPRHDAANVSRGWSVGQSDIEAARWIEQDAQGRVYTVLANQSVSAAAVREYGFKRYAGDVFYYPIPTGGALYQTYLEAVGEEPSLEIIREAGQLGQSDLVYVVLNDYWWDAQRVGEDLSTIADKEAASSDGRVRMFRFETK